MEGSSIFRNRPIWRGQNFHLPWWTLTHLQDLRQYCLQFCWLQIAWSNHHLICICPREAWFTSPPTAVFGAAPPTSTSTYNASAPFCYSSVGCHLCPEPAENHAAAKRCSGAAPAGANTLPWLCLLNALNMICGRDFLFWCWICSVCLLYLYGCGSYLLWSCWSSAVCHWLGMLLFHQGPYFEGLAFSMGFYVSCVSLLCMFNVYHSPCLHDLDLLLCLWVLIPCLQLDSFAFEFSGWVIRVFNLIFTSARVLFSLNSIFKFCAVFVICFCFTFVFSFSLIPLSCFFGSSLNSSDSLMKIMIVLLDSVSWHSCGHFHWWTFWQDWQVLERRHEHVVSHCW